LLVTFRLHQERFVAFIFVEVRQIFKWEETGVVDVALLAARRSIEWLNAVRDQVGEVIRLPRIFVECRERLRAIACVEEVLGGSSQPGNTSHRGNTASIL
jgi:hypothetical protein